jgi:hypothetical protein
MNQIKQDLNCTIAELVLYLATAVSARYDIIILKEPAKIETISLQGLKPLLII